MDQRRTMISLERLYRYFGPTKAVDDVSFTVERGEVFGFIGPNGAGKTTSMRILATLDVPSYGDATVDGFSVVHDPDRVRRRLGFMPDYYGTYTNVNCYEYLDFFARAYGIVGAGRHRAIQHVMGFTGLDKLAHKPTSGLSKGMKQRLCLGRAMIHNPSVLVLDEPAAGLDPRARIELRSMTRQLAADNKTVLVGSHILTELAEMCDRVGIIEKGSLLAVGTVEEIQQEQTSRSEVLVRLLQDSAKLATWLECRGHVEPVIVDGQQVKFRIADQGEQQANLVREMILAGFSITEFSTQSKTLEDVFMHVTKGVVQ